MIVIGITGSIGMGKTTASGILRDLGVPVHDSDAEVHKLLGPNGRAVEEIAVMFPGTLRQDKEGRAYIDRQALGRIVFADAKKKKQLEDFLHPIVRRASDDFRSNMKDKGHKFAALDIPLLFETNGEGRVDATLCLTAPPDVQRQRVLSRIGMTREKFERILASQMPDAEKRERADFVIDTSRGLEDTKMQLQDMLKKLEGKKKHA